MRDLRLTLLQAELHWQNPTANRSMFERHIADNAETSDLILMPETFTTGFTMDAANNNESADGDTAEWMKTLATKHGIALCGSLIIRDGKHYYNRALWAQPDGELFSYDKRHLFRMVGERDTFTAGTERRIIQLGDWRICPMICYDLRFPVWSRGSDEYDLLLYLANWPASRKSAWETLLPARAVENLCYVAGINRTGMDGNSVEYAGGSTIADYIGKKIALGGNQPETISATLSLEKLRLYREKFPAWKDADQFQLTKLGE